MKITIGILLVGVTLLDLASLENEGLNLIMLRFFISNNYI